MLGLGAAAIAQLLAAAPRIVADGTLPPGIEREAPEAWAEIEQRARAAGLPLAVNPGPLRLRADPAIALPRSGAGRPGVVHLRPGLTPDAARAALRHELAHQVLWASCPPAAGDRLFHEAFALLATGEIALWEGEPFGLPAGALRPGRAEPDGEYLSRSAAARLLDHTATLDTSAARRALARLLAGAPPGAGGWPRPISRRLARCDAGARWIPVSPAELAEGEAEAADALVVLSRHSGEVLVETGAARVPMPFGSTLKPFLVAGASAAAPALRPDAGREEWACGEGLPERMTAGDALARSCNGFFLDWAARAPQAARFGSYGAVLLAAGLPRLPRSAAEAIGLEPRLALSPLGLARAYRILAEGAPAVLDALRRTATSGTLAGVPDSALLSRAALKTGTVRDGASRPLLGWIVAVDDDRVVVMARAGKKPRTFAPELAAILRRPAARGALAAEVQVFGLVEDRDVVARCAGAGFSLSPGGPVPIPAGTAPLADLLVHGVAVCLEGAFRVRVAGSEERTYAGIFRRSPVANPRALSEGKRIHHPLPPGEGRVRGETAGPDVPERARRARRGSDAVFRTTRLLYTAGVLAAEEAALRGEARVALAEVIAHNVAERRHPGRPVCDTTHCQAFRGTAPPGREERAALESPPLRSGWLLFSRGGDTPWREERPLAEVERALGRRARDLSFSAGRVRFAATASTGSALYDEIVDLPCEALRSPLRLPSCPREARLEGERAVFEGRGAGHGEGLDVAAAERSGLTAAEILRRAYSR